MKVLGLTGPTGAGKTTVLLYLQQKGAAVLDCDAIYYELLKTDAALRQAISALPYRPTTFIVSQRTASIRHADLIVVLDDGVTVGLGKHDELLESCDVYREIYNSQFKNEEVTA